MAKAKVLVAGGAGRIGTMVRTALQDDYEVRSLDLRPIDPYGIGKCLGEAAARYFSDYHGMSCICLRLGTVHGGDQPRAIRQYATLLTPNDLMRLYVAAVGAPDALRFGTYYGVSNH